MERQIRIDTVALTEAFHAFGFTLSFGEHKTAAVLSLCGAQSRQARRRLYGRAGLNGRLPVLFEHLPLMHLPLPAKYKHLGTYQAPSGSMVEELRYRAAQARAAYGEARRKVYKAKVIPLTKKAMLLSTTVLPKLLHGAGTWPPLTKREYRLFAGTVWALYRGILNVPRESDQRITSATCFAILGQPDPGTLLRTARLSYLSQIIRSGPDELWAAVRADQPYADLLQGDLRWLFEWCWSTTHLPHPTGHWTAWISHIQARPGQFKSLYKRARALVVHQYTTVAALDGLFRTLRRLSCLDAPALDSGDAHHAEVCLPCKRSYPTRTSWAGHAARVHGYRSRAFLLPSDRGCRSCGKVYASIGRLRRHLTAAPRCLEAWGTFLPTAPDLTQPGHPLVPPGFCVGVEREAPAFNFTGRVNEALLADLQNLEGSPEEAVWEAIESCIEPLCTLRETVLRWRSVEPATSWKHEVASNMLLLLDPEVIAESRQPSRETVPDDQAATPAWDNVFPIPMTASGPPVVYELAPPPAQPMSPYQPTNLTVRAAAAYSTWLEAACAKCAVAATDAASQPVHILCSGLQAALGPAAKWLVTCGFVFDDRGLHSAA